MTGPIYMLAGAFAGIGGAKASAAESAWGLLFFAAIILVGIGAALDWNERHP